jgi:hypothetical protein
MHPGWEIGFKRLHSCLNRLRHRDLVGPLLSRNVNQQSVPVFRNSGLSY